MVRYPFGILLTILLALFSQKASSQLTVDIEGGVVFTGYNDVRIPGSGGTFISFSDELRSNPEFFSRVKIGYRFGKRSEVLGLFAPLKLTYSGSVDRDVVFQGETYPANSHLNATYRFNSYRATYRYYALERDGLDIGIGLTLKVRDADIGITGDFGQESIKTDLGVVPLVNLWVHWQPTERFGLLLDADALAAPQGRAEDVLAAVTYRATKNLRLKAGYRLLEGGAENSAVYTFSMFHYGVFGVLISL